MFFKQMYNLLVLCLALASVVSEQNFCENGEPVETMFTMGEYTYSRKKSLYYRTKVGHPFNNSKSFNQDQIFPTDQTLKFESIDSGFMITKTPECEDMEGMNKGLCDIMQQKIKGKAFVIGKASTGSQEYKTYVFDAKGDLIAVTDPDELPFGMKLQGPTIGNFWPKEMSKAVQILHSTFDERNLNLVLIIHDITNKNKKLILYYYNLYDMTPSPQFTSVQDIQTINEKIWMKGFFHIPSGKPNAPRNVFAIATKTSATQIQSRETFGSEVILELNTNLGFDIMSTITSSDIYNCSGIQPSPQLEAPPTETTTDDGVTEPVIPDHTTDKIDSQTSIPEKSGTTEPEIEYVTTSPPTQAPGGDESGENTTSKTLIWILLIVFTIGIVLFVILISIFTYVRLQKPKRKEKAPKL